MDKPGINPLLPINRTRDVLKRVKKKMPAKPEQTTGKPENTDSKNKKNHIDTYA